MEKLGNFVEKNKIIGAVFDMDGTLTDSMRHWHKIYAELSDILGMEVPQDFLMRVNHISMRRRVELLVKEYALDVDVAAVYVEWTKRAASYYHGVFKIKPYMLEAVKQLSRAHVAMAIATASDVVCAKAFLQSNALEGYICSVTGLDEVSKPKNEPDIYWKAAEKIGVSPSHCLVFEDSLSPAVGAKRGGFFVCGVRDDCSLADREEIVKIADIALGFD